MNVHIHVYELDCCIVFFLFIIIANKNDDIEPHNVNNEPIIL